MFRELARKNKQISMEECIAVLKEETRGVLSVLGDDDYPYGMPMNHFYNDEDGKIYFHCGAFGHRLEALRSTIRFLSAFSTRVTAMKGNGRSM